MRAPKTSNTNDVPSRQDAPWGAVALALVGGLAAVVALSSLGPLIG